MDAEQSSFFTELDALIQKHGFEFEAPGWPTGLTVSGTDRFTKNRGGGVWRIRNIDFYDDEIALQTIDGKNDFCCTADELLNLFTKLEPSSQ